jgi:NAD(P)-dependent dehydrogenase (short-subunit alcohol dehydrogenase family)
MSKTILITGASTDFGGDTAETLGRAGHSVFASMRDPQVKNRDHAVALRKQGIAVIELDVSSDASVDRAVGEVLVQARRIDVLVNNAGVASAGTTEPFTADQTNFPPKRTSSSLRVIVSLRSEPIRARSRRPDDNFPPSSRMSG